MEGRAKVKTKQNRTDPKGNRKIIEQNKNSKEPSGNEDKHLEM